LGLDGLLTDLVSVLEDLGDMEAADYYRTRHAQLNGESGSADSPGDY